MNRDTVRTVLIMNVTEADVLPIRIVGTVGTTDDSNQSMLNAISLNSSSKRPSFSFCVSQYRFVIGLILPVYQKVVDQSVHGLFNATDNHRYSLDDTTKDDVSFIDPLIDKTKFVAKSNVDQTNVIFF